MELPWLARWQPQIARSPADRHRRCCSSSTACPSCSPFRYAFPVQPLPPMLIAAGVIEMVAGVLVTLGLFTRLAAFIASGEMAVGLFHGPFAEEASGRS